MTGLESRTCCEGKPARQITGHCRKKWGVAFPAVASKKITAAFDGGRITSDGGVMVLAQAERRLAIAEKLAAGIPDPRESLPLVPRPSPSPGVRPPANPLRQP